MISRLVVTIVYNPVDFDALDSNKIALLAVQWTGKSMGKFYALNWGMALVTAVILGWDRIMAISPNTSPSVSRATARNP